MSKRIDTLHNADTNTVLQKWEHSVKNLEPFSNLQRMKVYDDAYRYFEVYAKARRDTLTHKLNWIGVSLDVDER